MFHRQKNECKIRGFRHHHLCWRLFLAMRIFLLVVASLLLETSMALAEETGFALRPGNGRFFALPLELDLDSGASNGDAAIFRLMPLYSFPVSDNWKLVNLNLITIADAPGGRPGQPGNPDPESGDRVLGIGDLIHASFATPKSSGNLIWGVGAMLSIPIASKPQLGSGKWSAGPAARISYKTGPWSLGAFGGQQWSFAGDDERNDISQLMIRAVIRRQLPNDWFFVSAPIITANWNASHDQRWLVPLGGGFGKRFHLARYPWAWSTQGYYNVIKPDGAPNWAIRFAFVVALPLSDHSAAQN